MRDTQHTAPHCTTLQHTATHGNTLHHPMTHCSTPQHNTCKTLQHTAPRCNTLQHAAPAAITGSTLSAVVSCHMLQWDPPCCNCTFVVAVRLYVRCCSETLFLAERRLTFLLFCVFMHNYKSLVVALRLSLLQREAGTSLLLICNTLQHTATHCNTLQHTAAHSNTLQHMKMSCPLF